MPAPQTIGAQVVRVAAAGWPEPITLVNGGQVPIYLGQTYGQGTPAEGMPLTPGSSIVWDAYRPLYASCETGQTSQLWSTANTGPITTAPVDTQVSGGGVVLLGSRDPAAGSADGGYTLGPFDVSGFDGFELFFSSDALGTITTSRRKVTLVWQTDPAQTQVTAPNTFDTESHVIWLDGGSCTLRGKVKAPALYVFVGPSQSGIVQTRDTVRVRGLLRMPDTGRVNRYDLGVTALAPTLGPTVALDGTNGAYRVSWTTAGLIAGATDLVYPTSTWSGPALLNLSVTTAIATAPLEVGIQSADGGSTFYFGELPVTTATRSYLNDEIVLPQGMIRLSIFNASSAAVAARLTLMMKRYDQ